MIQKEAFLPANPSNPSVGQLSHTLGQHFRGFGPGGGNNQSGEPVEMGTHLKSHEIAGRIEDFAKELTTRSNEFVNHLQKSVSSGGEQFKKLGNVLILLNMFKSVLKLQPGLLEQCIETYRNEEKPENVNFNNNMGTFYKKEFPLIYRTYSDRPTRMALEKVLDEYIKAANNNTLPTFGNPKLQEGTPLNDAVENFDKVFKTDIAVGEGMLTSHISSTIIPKLDKIASQLEDKGMKSLATQIDMVSNSLESL